MTAAYGGVAGVDALIGGWLTDAYGFRAVFGFITVFGLLATAAAAWTVPRTLSVAPGRMDWPGAAVLCLGLAAIQFGVGIASFAQRAVVFSLIGAGVVLLGLFVRIESRRRHPLLSLGHLRSRQVWPVLLTSALSLAGVLSVINYTIPLLAVHGRGYGYSATATALRFIVPACAVTVLPGINSACFGLGASIGIALAAQLAARPSAPGDSPVAGFQSALWMAVGCAVMAFLASLAVAGQGNRNGRRWRWNSIAAAPAGAIWRT